MSKTRPRSLLRRADEDAAVTIRRRLLVERPQAFREDAAGLFERDRADRRHRPQLAEHPQDATRPAQHARRERGEALEPFAPRRGARPRPPARRRAAGRRPSGARDCRCRARAAPTRAESGILTLRFAQLPVELAAQAAQPAPPAFRIAADHGRVDDQLFPLPRRPQTHRRRPSRPSPFARSAVGLAVLELLRLRFDAREAGDRIVCRHGEARVRARPPRRPGPVRGTGIRRIGWPTGARPRRRAWPEMPGRPGCGRRAPRSNQPGMPARSKASSSRPT